MSRDHRRPQQIDFARIAEAEAYYEAAGFPRTAAPWVVGDGAYFATAPSYATPYATLGSYLVASGEQSFIAMMDAGWDPGRAQCTTPCFRDEEHDALHAPYFLKVELIQTGDTGDEALERLVAAALAFFRRHVPARVEDLGDGTLDIVGERTGIELGSYGRRSARGHTWLYATGLAEPRLAQVIEAERAAA